MVNIQLAEECPFQDKAFCNSTHGKVLGIEFNTENLSWRLPEDKRSEYANLVHSALSSEELTLEECQKLTGKLNFVCSMAPWARTFMRPLQIFQTTLEESSMSAGVIPEEVGRDLLFWWKFISDHAINRHTSGTPHRGPPTTTQVLHYRCCRLEGGRFKPGGRVGVCGFGRER